MKIFKLSLFKLSFIQFNFKQTYYYIIRKMSKSTNEGQPVQTHADRLKELNEDTKK